MVGLCVEILEQINNSKRPMHDMEVLPSFSGTPVK